MRAHSADVIRVYDYRLNSIIFVDRGELFDCRFVFFYTLIFYELLIIAILFAEFWWVARPGNAIFYSETAVPFYTVKSVLAQ